MATRQMRLDSIDLAKFVLSILVVSIHVDPFGGLQPYTRPLQRLAVPLFFLITSYFFFSGYVKCVCTEERIVRLEKYIKRNMQLYLFWFVATLAPTLAERKWFEEGFLKGLAALCHSFIFGGTFRVSWFIMACAIAASAVVVMSRHLRNWQIIILTAIPYVACCLLTNYVQHPFVAVRVEAIKSMFEGGAYSFWAALLWFSLGKWLVENEEGFSKVSVRTLVYVALLGGVVLCFENYAVLTNGWVYKNYSDCYFSLPIVCVPLFLLLLRAPLKVPFARELRCVSTITYCLHATLGWIFKNWLVLPVGPKRLFLAVLVSCWVVAGLIMALERLPHMKWLRFAH